SPVLATTPSLTHCQNCVCVVQNSFRSRQITSAVFFFLFFFSFFLAFAFPLTSMPTPIAAVSNRALLSNPTQRDRREAGLNLNSCQISTAKNSAHQAIHFRVRWSPHNMADEKGYMLNCQPIM